MTNIFILQACFTFQNSQRVKVNIAEGMSIKRIRMIRKIVFFSNFVKTMSSILYFINLEFIVHQDFCRFWFKPKLSLLSKREIDQIICQIFQYLKIFEVIKLIVSNLIRLLI